MKPESTMDPDSAPGPVRVDVTANRRARRLDGALRGLDDRRRPRIEADTICAALKRTAAKPWDWRGGNANGRQHAALTGVLPRRIDSE